MHREIGMNDLSAAAKIRKLIKKYDPDIVYTHSSKTGAIGRLADIGLYNRCIYNPHGWVDSPLDYVELFDVALLLSRWEGFGLALPEYMMAGKPIVASNVDAIPDIIEDHVNGLLVPPEDEDAAYHAVMEILSDKELRETLIQNGLKDVHTRFNVKRAAKEHEELFKKIVDDGNN